MFKKGNEAAEGLRRELLLLYDIRQTTLLKAPAGDRAALEAAGEAYMKARDDATDRHPVIARLAELFPKEIPLLALQTPGERLATATHEALTNVTTGTKHALGRLKSDSAWVWRLPPFVRAAAQALGYGDDTFLETCVEEQIGVAEETPSEDEVWETALGQLIMMLALVRNPVAAVSYRLLALAALGLALEGFQDDMARAATNIDPLVSALGEDPSEVALLAEFVFNAI
jgi:hypothetical protein